MSMAKQGAKAAVPRLRFPEFQDAGEWTIGELEGVANFVNEKISVSTLSTCDYISTENLLPDYGETVVSTKLPDVASVTRYKCGDVLISNIRPYLKKVWRADKDGGASNDVIVVRAKTSLSEAFLSLVLRNDAFIAYVMESAKGVKMPRGDIGAMRQYPLAYPTPSEQQKIADCLTSLGEVIAAQGRKVEALKTHKRGLMQQLFPREGETRPRLRFPEFRDAPEWMQQRIEAFARDGLTNGIFNDTKRQSSSYRLINVSEMYLPNPICESDLAFAHAGDEEIKKKLAHTGDIFFTRSSLVREGIAYSNIYLGAEKRVAFDGHLIRLRPKLDVVVPVFLHYALKSDVVRSQFIAKSKSATMTTIGQRDVGETGLAIPQLEEQQRIADCLASLDTQITAESNRLAALKTHKQGLMQQLFPAPETTGA